jgi:ribose transport system ATP-binding protein
VEIAKAVAVKAKICIFDEPTAALTLREIEKLFQVILKFKSEGVGIIYISHRLQEVFKIGDRITVLRNGEYVATKAAAEVNTDELIEMMIGRKVEEEVRRRGKTVGQELLRVEALCGSRFRDVSLTVRSGEIVGIAGLVGSGRTELLRAVFGADRSKRGRVIFKGEPLQLSSPRQAARQKIALLPEDRKRHGLVMCRSVEENISLSALDRASHLGVLIKSKITERARALVKSLMIKTPSLRQPVMYLSGGNQQKVIIARWLSAESDLLMFDEPTRGIDVGAKQEVYHLIFQLAEQNKGILVVSSEIPELMRICDRVYVMHEGSISAELETGAISSDRILNAAFGRADGSSRV